MLQAAQGCQDSDGSSQESSRGSRSCSRVRQLADPARVTISVACNIGSIPTRHTAICTGFRAAHRDCSLTTVKSVDLLKSAVSCRNVAVVSYLLMQALLHLGWSACALPPCSNVPTLCHSRFSASGLKHRLRRKQRRQLLLARRRSPKRSLPLRLPLTTRLMKMDALSEEAGVLRYDLASALCLECLVGENRSCPATAS